MSTETCRICNEPPSRGQRPIRCERCRAVFYCTSACRNLASASHEAYCKPPQASLPASPPAAPVTGVRLSAGPDLPFAPQVITVPPQSPVWTTGRVSPLSQLVDMPILIHRERAELPLGQDNIANLDNQAVTYFMIDPQTGLAPTRWLKNIGDVTVVRADQQPLSINDLENFFVFCQNLLGVFTFTRRSPDPAQAYKREAFQRFASRYREACAAVTQSGRDVASLDFSDGPVPLTQIPMEVATGAANPSRGLQWLEIGPTARRYLTRFSGADILPNGQVADILIFDDDVGTLDDIDWDLN